VRPITVDHDQLESADHGNNSTDLHDCKPRSLGTLHQNSFSELLAHRALCLIAMFARLPPSSSDLAERKNVVPPSPPADRRREHRESAAVSLAAV
jgi:hypothetical protein